MKRLALLAGATALSAGAFAQNLVANPGFEAHATTWTPEWTTVFASAFLAITTTPANVHSGTNALQMGATSVTSQDEITQTIATLPGMYLVSFWGRQSGGNITNSNQRVSFGGIEVFNGVMTTTYTQYSASIVASGTSTVLRVKGWNSPAFNYGDDFSVTAVVPEPASILAVGAGLAALVARRRHKLILGSQK